MPLAESHTLGDVHPADAVNWYLRTALPLFLDVAHRHDTADLLRKLPELAPAECVASPAWAAAAGELKDLRGHLASDRSEMLLGFRAQGRRSRLYADHASHRDLLESEFPALAVIGFSVSRHLRPSSIGWSAYATVSELVATVVIAADYLGIGLTPPDLYEAYDAGLEALRDRGVLRQLEATQAC